MGRFYPDDVGISKFEKSGGIEFEVTKNVDKFDLARNGIYLGNPDKEKTEEVTKDTDTPATPKEYDGQKIRTAINKLIDNHDFSDETEKFLNRTANQLIINKRENVDPKDLHQVTR